MPSAVSRPRWPVWLSTFTGNLYMVVGTLFFATVALLTSWIPPRGRVFFFWARIWSRQLLAASGVRVKATFEEPLAVDRSYVFMVNHRSLFDIPVLLGTLPFETRFLAKRELFKIPLFGWALRAGGFIAVDRAHRSQAIDAFQEGIDRLREGVSVLVFPEETRSRDGRLLPFKRGGFLLALKAGAAIVPVGLDGTGSVQGAADYSITAVPVRVRFGRPVAPGDGVRQREELTRAVRDRIEELAGLVPEVGEPVPGGDKLDG